MRLTLLPLLALLSTPALAQEPNCGTIDQVESALAAAGQTLDWQGIGTYGGNHMTRTYVAPDGSWSIVLATPDGFTCVVDYGTDWQERNDPAPVPETGL